MLTPDSATYCNRANIRTVQKSTQARIFGFLSPLILGLGFAFKIVYYVTFAWWMAPWLRHKANRELVSDIERCLYFLISGPSTIRVLHTEWPTAEILSGNLVFTILRWRDETTVSVAPRHSPTQSYQLGSLDDTARLLQKRVEDLNAAFSEKEFSRATESFILPDFMRDP
jgi:hypothetical protein